MLKNYFKTAIRSLKKHSFFSAINIFGLAIGLTAAIFIFQYAGFQKSFDQHFSDHDRIYRVMNERFEGDNLIQRGQITYSAVGPQLMEDYPEVEVNTTLNFYTNVVFRYGDNVFVQDRVPFADELFFEVFDYKVLAGDRSTLLNEPLSVVLTESAAEKLIGPKASQSDYLNEIVYFHEDAFKVVGIMEDVAANSSLQFDMLLSRKTLFTWWGDFARYSWTGSDYFHYIKLTEGISRTDFSSKLKDFSEKYFRGNEVTGTFEEFHLQPLAEVHLDESYEYENHETADGDLINILLLIALFILVMAWVNYINLTTSRALQRAKEVGMRKVVGASIWQLRKQFIMEALLINLIGLVLAVTVVQILQSQYNQFTGIETSFTQTLLLKYNGVSVINWFLVIFVLGTLASATYPALVLSKYKPVQVLKGNFSNSKSGGYLRKGLVIFQFILSTSLIAFTFIVSNQTQFMRSYDLGFEKSQVLTFNGPIDTNLDTTFVTTIHAFIDELEKNPIVEKVGVSTAEFGDRLPRTFNVTRVGDEEGVMLNRMGTNYGFVDVYDIQMLAGRGFETLDHNSNGASIDKVVLNDRARLLLGFESPEATISKKINLFGREFIVIGVTDNFHFRSIKKSVEPLLMLPFYEVDGDTYHVKFNAQNTQAVVEFAEQKFSEFFPGDVFNYSFMDLQIQSQYKQDIQFGKVFNLFSFVGISIASLGLIGLVGFSATRRTKEIGVRKVLGASLLDILKVISVDFMALVAVASILAFPLIYLGANNWLASFEYRINLSFWFFLLPILLVLLVSLLIIVSQSYRTAQANPVKSLRED